ncbi:type II toxin-antitoxin system Phd/YefM family antitoxin [Brevundimonas sp. SL130]|uniref:type II toxin-antitoxin system Phd/YefM family antitoxin n=1 Tax=Brevundimonas sp. SL130 TaxID=2995143 RepID=UPI00226C726C|nr:type II toxin-antitoxin system prevent-host-death family antitoxin [Brevundimonas sp. SL130]WAC59316.1 type II toxin-antitoxin system prevent-host-death family antitoxin [Brevundimonas sp. SL130]
MAVTANIHEAKTTLSKLIERALAGEEVVIAKAGKPLVRLSPVTAADAAVDRMAAFDKYQGRVILDEAWDQPEFDEAMLDRLYGVEGVAGMTQVAEPPVSFDDK